MSLDGAARRKDRLEKISKKVKKSAFMGTSPSSLILWASRTVGLTNRRSEEYIKLLISCHELYSEGGRLFHRDFRSSIKSNKNTTTNKTYPQIDRKDAMPQSFS